MSTNERRLILRALGSMGIAAGLGACGGSGTEATASSASSASSSSPASSSSSSSSSSTSSQTIDYGNTDWGSSPAYSTTSTVTTMADFVFIQAPDGGTYTMRLPAGCDTSSGSNSDSVSCSSSGETVAMSEFYLSKYQVTNANWKAYLDANGLTTYPPYWSGSTYPSGKEKHPVLSVSYDQAVSFCTWLATRIAGYTFFVPSEAQWEWAALGTNSTYTYPWGASADVTYSGDVLTTKFNCNAVCAAYVLDQSGIVTLSYYNDTTVTHGTGYDATTDTAALASVMSISTMGGVTGWQYDSSDSSASNYKANADFANSDQFGRLSSVWGGYTTEVGSYESGKSWSGCYDMSGNCFEWTSTVGLAANGAEAATSVNIVRGGSWYATTSSGSCIMRGEGRSAGTGTNSVGIRVACTSV